jgi:hypothetical protein
VKRVSLGLVGVLILGGCAGYMPVARYARVTLPDPVYVGINLSGEEPRNGIYIKDEISKMVTGRFHNHLVKNKELSGSQIYVTRYKISYSPINYDKDGFVTRYKVDTNMDLKLYTSKGILDKKVSASEDVTIQSSSLLNSAAKERAIRASIQKALDKFVDLIAKEGIKEK